MTQTSALVAFQQWLLTLHPAARTALLLALIAVAALLSVRIFQRWKRYLHNTEPECIVEHRRIRINLTFVGLTMLATLVVMLLFSIRMALSFGYLLAFTGAAVLVAASYMTFFALHGVRITMTNGRPVFAGQIASFDLQVDPGRAKLRHALELLAATRGGRTNVEPMSLRKRDGARRLAITLPAQQRGVLPAPALRLQTHYPVGMWLAWTIWAPPYHCLVYPAPEANPPPLPAGGHDAVGVSLLQTQGSELVHGLRPYRGGDPVRRIAWRKVARGAETLSVKELDGDRDASGPLAFNDAMLAGLADQEARIGRLCAWVLAAEAAGRPYAVDALGIRMPLGIGQKQRDDVLEALARLPQQLAGSPARLPVWHRVIRWWHGAASTPAVAVRSVSAT